MTWAKKIDRRKFPRHAWVITRWSPQARKWFSAMYPNTDVNDDEPIAVGQGDDPLEAMLSMCIDAGAIADTGKFLRS